MTHVFHRMPRQSMPSAVGGDGVWVIAEGGRRYLDASGGAAVSCLGHSNERVKQAIIKQVETLPFIHSAFFTTDVLERLADKIAAAAPGTLNHVYFLSGGSEATESALKLARQYHLERGEPERTQIISRLHSYHGNTVGALSVSGNLWRREPYEPMLSANVHHIAPCYAYRHQGEGESLEAYGRRAADALEQAIIDQGPGRVAAFIAETVVGATLGAVPPAPGYFKRIREICDEHGVLLIMDEVMCGSGRTGTLFGFEQDDVVPDMVTMAKGLGGGYQPIGALVVSDAIFEAITQGTGFFQHGHTYMGHAAACAGALAVLEEIEERDLLANVRAMGGLLHDELQRAFADHPHVGDIRGRGLFQGVELVAERDGKVPFAPSKKLNARIKANAMEAGLICYPMGGTADGKSGDHVLLAPPFIVTPDDVREIVARLSTAIETSITEVA